MNENEQIYSVKGKDIGSLSEINRRCLFFLINIFLLIYYRKNKFYINTTKYKEGKNYDTIRLFTGRVA